MSGNFTTFGLPLLSYDLDTILQQIKNLPYSISCIKYRFFDSPNIKKIMVTNTSKHTTNTSKHTTNTIKHTTNTSKQTKVFKIKADIEPDIYNLITTKDGIEEYNNFALIPDYKTSVMMNSLFRNIKENDNLDALEESDDEDDFQDIRNDKFVHLDRELNMLCEYNHKFKKWVPISLV